MSKSIKSFIYMKVGDHAGESWSDILSRKNDEFEKAGCIFWGYGGTVCHPLTQVQPFAKSYVKEGNQIQLLMEPISSNADPDIVPASEYSQDGSIWEPVPSGVTVTGSRYALVLGKIENTEIEINLNEYIVGIGTSRGKSAASYIQRRIDKGCLTLSDSREPDKMLHSKGNPIKVIKYVAPLIEPYAVLLR